MGNTGVATAATAAERKPQLDVRARRRIQAWIHATGTTQTALADRVQKKQAWMSRYLSGEFNADLDTLAAIAEAFGHSIGALLDTAADPEEQSVIEAYRALTPEGRQIAADVLRMMAQRPRGRRRRG